MHDPLTGLLTRPTLFAALDGLSARGTTSGNEHSVLLIDVDRFKQYNDAFGQVRGDRLLVELASLMGVELPEPKQLGRLSGDEFLAVLPGTGLAAAVRAAEWLRAAAERTLGRQDSSGPITLTIAVATTPVHTAWTAEELLALADSRLIVAKKRVAPRRNRVWAGNLPGDWYRQRSAHWPSTGPFEPESHAADFRDR